MESREKKQQARSSRKAFKDQLESSAPTTNGSASPSIQRANSNMTKLLHWCQRITDGYPNVSVTNFTTSWKDGLAFCALLHNFVPDKIPFDELTAKRPRESFELAFTAAAEEGVPQLLEVDDMVRMECPDPKSVITYIHAIYQEFVTNRRWEDNAENWFVHANILTFLWSGEKNASLSVTYSYNTSHL